MYDKGTWTKRNTLRARMMAMTTQEMIDSVRLLRNAPMCFALPVKWHMGMTTTGSVRDRKTWLSTAGAGVWVADWLSHLVTHPVVCCTQCNSVWTSATDS